MDYTIVMVTEGNDPAGLSFHRPLRCYEHRRILHGKRTGRTHYL
jgi:hypothetical protein